MRPTSSLGLAEGAAVPLRAVCGVQLSTGLRVPPKNLASSNLVLQPFSCDDDGMQPSTWAAISPFGKTGYTTATPPRCPESERRFHVWSPLVAGVQETTVHKQEENELGRRASV